jgi:hypothetical protein
MIPDTFWPSSLIGWFTVFGMLATAVGAVVAFARTLDKINGFGERLNDHINGCDRLEGRVDAAERAMALSQVDRTNLHESLARLTSEMQTLLRVAQSAQIERMEDLGEIRERLVRIETKVDRSA